MLRAVQRMCSSRRQPSLQQCVLRRTKCTDLLSRTGMYASSYLSRERATRGLPCLLGSMGRGLDFPFLGICTRRHVSCYQLCPFNSWAHFRKVLCRIHEDLNHLNEWFRHAITGPAQGPWIVWLRVVGELRVEGSGSSPSMNTGKKTPGGAGTSYNSSPQISSFAIL